MVRGLKTRAVGMDWHSQNAMEVATFFEGHPAIGRMVHPGSPSNPGHEIAMRRMRVFSGTVSFEMSGGFERARELVEGTKLFILAESLGGVESLIEHPSKLTPIKIEGPA